MQPQSLHIRLITGLMLLAFMAQSFNRTWVVADYWLNTGYYAAHCENKARPEMHCNGKCQMMKQIRAEERKDAEHQERLSEKFDTTPLSSRHFFTDWQGMNWKDFTTPLDHFEHNTYADGYLSGLLRPPIA